MAIVPMLKATVLGLLPEKQEVIERLQELGFMHVVSLRDQPAARAELPEVAVEAHEALKYLKSCPIQRPAAKRGADFDLQKLVREVTELERRQRALSDERDHLVKSLESVRPWGEFRVPPPEHLAGLRLWFFLVPREEAGRLSSLEDPWQVVGQSEGKDQVVVVSPEEPRGVPGQLVELDPRPLSELEDRIAKVDLELEEVQLARARATRFIPRIEQRLAEADDQASLRHAMQQTLDEQAVFAVQGWVPSARADELRSFAKKRGLGLHLEEPADTDSPPTLLQNPELLAGGESTVTFYMTPGYRSWDPSLLVMFAFATFFAMIFADAGYSLVLALLLGSVWRRMSRTRSGVRLRNLFVLIVLFALLYGVGIGSYFGVPAARVPGVGGALDALRVRWLDTTNNDQMMLISILIGVFHLVLANLVVAWRNRTSVAGLVNLAWANNFVGGLLMGLSSYQVIGARHFQLGMWMLIGGAATVLFFSSSRPLPPRSLADALMRFVDGILALTKASAAFADVLSYLRLFALGLASAQLAGTFNQLASDAGASLGSIGILATALVFLLGHTLNFALGIMSGVVHGLRLNCIEFFNWSGLEEGQPFRAFSKKART